MPAPGRAALLLVLTLPTCAPPLPGRPITNPAERITINGASVLPPQSPGWSLIQEPNRALFVAIGNGPNGEPDRAHTLVATLTAGPLQGTKLDNLKDMQAMMDNIIQGEGGRGTELRLLNREEAQDPTLGPACYRYSYTLEERGNRLAPNTTLIMTRHGTACHHPDASAIQVDLSYSERRPENQPALLGPTAIRVGGTIYRPVPVKSGYRSNLNRENIGDSERIPLYRTSIRIYR